MAKELKLGSDSETQMLQLVVRAGLKVWTHLVACCCNMFAATSENLFWKSLSPWQNFPPPHVSPIQTDLILCNVLQGQNAIMETKIFTKIFQYTWRNLLLRHVTANWGSDLSSLCVALTCQLVCSDLKPMTAYCESSSLNIPQCYLMSLYCSHDYYMKPTYVIKVNWYPTKRQNQIQMECFREFQYL